MGFIPIFLYLSAAVFLFGLVVASNLKNKKMAYQQSFDRLMSHIKDLSEKTPEQTAPLEEWKLDEVEKYYISQKKKADKEKSALLDQKVKPYLAQTKRYLYWYNNMIKTKPYSFVASILGYSPI